MVGHGWHRPLVAGRRVELCPDCFDRHRRGELTLREDGRAEGDVALGAAVSDPDDPRAAVLAHVRARQREIEAHARNHGWSYAQPSGRNPEDLALLREYGRAYEELEVIETWLVKAEDRAGSGE